MSAYSGVVDQVVAFLNTLDVRSFGSHEGGDVLSAWLGEDDRNGLAEGLRGALRNALSEGAEPALAAFPLRLVPDSAGGLRLAAQSPVPALTPIVETVANAVATGAWARIKLCAAPECRWAFQDVSRNGGSRWCSMAVCGNRHKTRAYRQRRS
ncbi:hypothetical protein Ahu01nite_098510 [Winogradskya humida]|uniref:Zinc finger CGNR domain-containing protein n=1 Tax=Winogradskya humida TaxID=113566 RepID=A0ABQ4A7B1_9ACTN|nr:hypothetical protein Ahu01nite_098510 [Actinoplanes humidus]